MFKEILIWAGPIIASALTLLATQLINRWTRTREEKRHAKYSADLSGADVDAKRVSVDQIKDEYLRESLSSAYKQLDDMGERLNNFRERLLDLEDQLFKATQRALSAERERDKYKSLLSRLISVVVSCNGCNVDIEEFQNALE
jgi:chromosome segregation ATPase